MTAWQRFVSEGSRLGYSMHELSRAWAGAQRNPSGVRIVHNRLLGGWYVVTGPHQTPISGRFPSKAAAAASLERRRNPSRPRRRRRNPRRATNWTPLLWIGGLAGLAWLESTQHIFSNVASEVTGAVKSAFGDTSTGTTSGAIAPPRRWPSSSDPDVRVCGGQVWHRQADGKWYGSALCSPGVPCSQAIVVADTPPC